MAGDRLAAAAPIRTQPWELPYAVGVALKSKEKKKVMPFSSTPSVSSHFRASTTLAAHREAVKVVLKASVLKEDPVWHYSQPPTGNAQEVEKEAMKLEARQRPGSLVGP